MPSEYLGSVCNLSHARAIVVHSVKSLTSAGYRLMLIEEEEYRSVRFEISALTISSRLGVSEGTVNADRWFSLVGRINSEVHSAERRLILLG